RTRSSMRCRRRRHYCLEWPAAPCCWHPGRLAERRCYWSWQASGDCWSALSSAPWCSWSSTSGRRRSPSMQRAGHFCSWRRSTGCIGGKYSSRYEGPKGSMKSFVSHLESALDGTRLEANRVHTVHQGRPIWVRYDLAAIRQTLTPALLTERPKSLWRYRELL